MSQKKIRLIGRLDIKGPNLIKGIQLEGLRVIGDPIDFAVKYYREGIDELIFMDSVASLYGRNNLSSIIARVADEIFVPITVGGGIRSLKDAENILRGGADKVAINTAIVKNPRLIREIAYQYGSQAVVASIEAKQNSNGDWEVMIENGRDPTGLNVMDWVKTVAELGAGEILLTSVDREGTRRGFDLDLISRITSLVKIPLLVSGGMGSLQHFAELIKIDGVDGVVVADALHYSRESISDIKKVAISEGRDIRYEE